MLRRMGSATRLRSFGLDRYAIALSGLCVAHCVASAVALAVMSAAGGALLHPAVHELGLMLAILLGAVALGRGAVQHGYVLPIATGSLGLGIMAGAMSIPHAADGTMLGGEVMWTIVGVAILALGHDLNRRAVA